MRGRKTIAMTEIEFALMALVWVGGLAFMVCVEAHRAALARAEADALRAQGWDIARQIVVEEDDFFKACRWRQTW